MPNFFNVHITFVFDEVNFWFLPSLVQFGQKPKKYCILNEANLDAEKLSMLKTVRNELSRGVRSKCVENLKMRIIIIATRSLYVSLELQYCKVQNMLYKSVNEKVNFSEENTLYFIENKDEIK